MAEVVERNLEDSLNEIIYMKKAKLFNKSEINELIRRRRQHEYALQKRNKRVLDYNAYITTELTILKLLRFRRQQLCYRFQSRIDVWIRFIDFCKILGRHVSVGRIWNRMLQVHGRTDPRLWAAAAAYHLDENAKAQIKTNVRKLSLEKDNLSEQQQRLREESQLLSQHGDEQHKKKLTSVMIELNQNTTQLLEAAVNLARERRLVWDRINLNAIREARRLLTEGLELNPDCVLLNVELVKLEAAAADFFHSRVSDRHKAVNDQTEPVTLVASEPMGKIEKRKILVAKSVAVDDVQFMSEVTENVPFIASGESLKLVMQSVLDRWSSDPKVLESLQQVATAVSHLVDDSIRQNLSERLEQTNVAAEKAELELALKTADVSDRSETIRARLAEQIVQLNKTVLDHGIDSAFQLWDSWYQPASSGGAPSVDQFRLLNPQWPEAVGLLRLRLKLLQLHASWYDATDASSTVSSVQHVRQWFDSLATSWWGSTSEGEQ